MNINPEYLHVRMPALDWPYLLGLMADQKDDPVVRRLRDAIISAVWPYRWEAITEEGLTGRHDDNHE